MSQQTNQAFPVKPLAADVVADRTGGHRPVRSFVLRQGRMSDAQARAFEAGMPQFGVPYRPARLDLDALFGRTGAKVLEIGFGMGDTTAAIAAAAPETDFLGIEVHAPGVGNLCKHLTERGLGNVRIVRHDAVEVLRDMIAPDGLDGVHVFFPDPWPKKRHHKRRLIQPPLVALLSSRLKPGGYLHLATDWEDYALQMRVVLQDEPLLVNSVSTSEGFALRPAYRPLTRFEQRGLNLGHGVWDLVFRRR